MADTGRKGLFRRKASDVEESTGIQEVVEPGPVKHIHFDGSGGEPSAPRTEREVVRLETTTYAPHHNASMDDIHREIDTLNQATLPRVRSLETRTRTVYSTETGKVTKAEGGASGLFVSNRAGPRESERRFTSSVVDSIIEDVDLNAPMQDYRRVVTGSPQPAGPFVYNGYLLHRREVQLRGGGTSMFYFFSKNTPKSGVPSEMPDGYEVDVNRRTGLPFLRRIGSPRKARKASASRTATTTRRTTRRATSRPKAITRKTTVRRRRKTAKVATLRTAPAKRTTKTRPRRRKAAVVATPPAVRGTGKGKGYKPQCTAITADGKQCRNSARFDSAYCASHPNYHPKTLAQVIDTAPSDKRAKDTHAGGTAHGKVGHAVQCTALTGDDKQCRNNARPGKTTCASHKFYRPKSTRQIRAKLDTRPRWKKAKDTKPKTRKGR